MHSLYTRNKSKPRLLILTTSTPDLKSKSTWDMLLFNLFNSLRKYFIIVNVINVDTSENIRVKTDKIISKLPGRIRGFYKRKYTNWYRSRNAFRKRSREATKIVKSFSNIDAIFQSSALFFPETSIPVFMYLDATLPLALNCSGHSASPVTLLSKKIIKEAMQIDKFVYNKMAGILTWSEWCSQSVIKDFGINTNKVHNVGVGTGLRLESQAKKNDDGKTILFAGKDFERKGGPLLIEAFKIAREEIPNLRLTIVGSNPPIEGKGIKVIGYIEGTQTDFMKRMIELYQTSTILVMPSYYETFGLVYLEAMYFGVPCIALKKEPISEFVIDHNTGILIDEPNPQKLANTIIELMTNKSLLQKLSRNARALVLEKYTWDKIVRNIYNVIAKEIEYE